MFQSNKSTNSLSSILGPELKIEGNINVKGDLLIYGEVNGSIICQGTVNAAKGSIVKGNIHAQNASVNGKIEGDLEVELKAVLGKGSHLEGNLQASFITIEEGARFDGMCHMINKKNASSNTQTIHDASLNPNHETSK